MKTETKNWILSANISFSFNGTKQEAIEKLKEDMDFLEEEIFVRDSMEYMISDKIINKGLSDKCFYANCDGDECTHNN